MSAQDPNDDRFHTTHWSLIAQAGSNDLAQAKTALETLCAAYWLPLYAFIRRNGHSIHESQDLTQEFFTRLLDKNDLQAADRQRGRFRSFLLGAVKHFLAKQRKAARAQKRGGGKKTLSLDFHLAEEAYQIEAVDHHTPELLFERQWALVLLDRVMQRLTDEHTQSHKGDQFARLREFLTAGTDHPPYGDVASELETTEAAVKMAVHRLRKRYRELLRSEIGQTVADPVEIDDELRQLFAVLSQKSA